MKRIFAAAAMIALLAAPAAAQMGSRSGAGQQQREKTPLDLQYEKERIEQQENERAYNEQMKRMKSQAPTTKTDPWAGVRPTTDSTNAKR
jgi:hypothetical protein